MEMLSFSIAGILLFVMLLSVTVHILLHKNDVSSAIGWIGLVWLVPILGSVFYVLFGINRIRRKANRLYRRRPRSSHLTSTTQVPVTQIPPSLSQLLHLGYKVHPQYMSTGNTVTALCNGDEAYPRMCAAIAAAKHTVLIASYIFSNDTAGQEFVQAIKQAAQNGAAVRILVDGVGLNYSHPSIDKALRALKGVEFATFLPSKHPINLPFVNLRNHRKIMIIDGETAFFGGMNISEGNLLSRQPKDPIQDVTFEVRGPVIRQMEQIFEEDWTFAGQKAFRAAPKTQTSPTGKIPMRIIPDGPDGDYGKIEHMCLGALSCAQKNIRIVTPYFLPENEILSALETAAMRGVRVEIILPQKSNIWGMDWAMRANFQRLISKGIHLYLSRPPFDHSKLFLVDDIWLFAGSANWDVRSFKLNFESNMECFDAELAGQVSHIIEQKKKLATRITQANGSLLCRLRNNLFRLLTPYY